MSGSLCVYCSVFGFDFVLVVYGLDGLVDGLVSGAFEGGFSGFLVGFGLDWFVVAIWVVVA